jgi:hypothetical protein
MIRNLLLIALLSAVFAFNIQKKLGVDIVVNDDSRKLKAISWPFSICGSEDKWTANKVTLNKAPAKGAQLEV